VRQVLEAQGVEVTYGFLHIHNGGRDSLVYDLRECARESANELMLDFLAESRLHACAIRQTPAGRCRLLPGVAQVVVAPRRVSQEQLEAHAKW
jgi:CRISPR associated protein, Cas1 family